MYIFISDAEYAIARKLGISKNNVNNRVNQLGWNKYRAITKRVDRKTGHSKKWLNIAIQNGISSSTYYSRISRNKWSRERAATEPLASTGERTRKYPKEIYITLKENGIARSTFHNRIKNGWDIVQASTIPTKSNSRY